jgi:hypothetical protein
VTVSNNHQVISKKDFYPMVKVHTYLHDVSFCHNQSLIFNSGLPPSPVFALVISPSLLNFANLANYEKHVRQLSLRESEMIAPFPQYAILLGTRKQ